MLTSRFLVRSSALVAAAMLLASCSVQNRTASVQSTTPIPARLLAEMTAKGMKPSSPILVRVYKQDAEMELWKQTESGRYALLKSYPICRWSGQLGPKKTEGDRQVPEGFYTVSPGALNPNSKYYLSYDVGFPNNVDRQLGRSGGNIMVHGVCSSRGCLAMTNDQMGEIYAVTREALKGGQPNFQFQSYPFRMTAENMATNRKNPNAGFWQNLKQGSDNFEVTGQPPQVAACNGRYVFNGQGGQACGVKPGDASVAAQMAQKTERDQARFASLVASGRPAMTALYEDGGENDLFRARAVAGGIPGLDRPYTQVPQPTLVALNDSGTPASSADATAAAHMTYSAAETLLMSEAMVARRSASPQSSEAIGKRQLLVYARLIGTPMAKPAAPQTVLAQTMPVQSAPAQSPSGQASGQISGQVLAFAETGSTRLASAGPLVLSPAPVVLASAGGESSRPFYAGMLRYVGLGGEPAPAQGVSQVAVVAPDNTGSTTVVKSAATDDQPFYQRWLGLGSAGPSAADQAQAAVPPAVGAIAEPESPRSDPRAAHRRRAPVLQQAALRQSFAAFEAN